MRTINKMVIQPNTPNDNRVLWLNKNNASYYNNGTWVTIGKSSEEDDVTNLPDEEDITSVNNKLKFKDREADATNFQSKGYVILRKNLHLVNGVVKNILT